MIDVKMFEGSEKKIEIIFSKNSPKLRSLSEKFWQGVVRACGANIISRLDFSDITSFLLSESSLFLWDHRLVMITCGKTELPLSFFKMLKGISRDYIELLFFQRKNEFFPQSQKSAFSQDIKQIQKKIKGKSYQFGFLHDHHFFLFHTESSYIPEPKDQTLEVLMYDSRNLQNFSSKKIEGLKKKLFYIFPGFEIQDHFFKPSGYSANAIRGSEYYTIHITPDRPFFYISFETNMRDSSVEEITGKVYNLFRPETFDLISFTPMGYKETSLVDMDLYCGTFFCRVLECGWQVVYKCFSDNKITPKEAVRILT